MKQYTILSMCGATGEGITYYIAYLWAEDNLDATKQFKELFGSYPFAYGNTMIAKGFQLDNLEEFDFLLSEKTKNLLRGDCHTTFHASFHMNCS